ncbi:putative RNA-directed DNA polymerase from transposon X-element, partial [Stegodyphus mimosarum]
MPKLHTSNGVVYSDKDKADAIAEHLENTFTHNPEPYDEETIEKVNNTVNNFLNTPGPRNFTFLTNPRLVAEIITHQKKKKSPGDDGIHNLALQNLPINAITCLTKIINSIIKFSYYPQQWKHATIVVFAKPNKNPSFPENYRPISLLSNIAKIADKIILFYIKQKMP